MPHMHWHPTTGESQVFADGEVPPEGWLSYHPADAEKAPPEPEPAKAPAKGRAAKTPLPAPEVPAAVEPNAPLTREEVIAALNEGSLAFNDATSTDDLTALLTGALLEVLAAAEMAIPEGASPRELLTLVRTE